MLLHFDIILDLDIRFLAALELFEGSGHSLGGNVLENGLELVLALHAQHLGASIVQMLRLKISYGPLRENVFQSVLSLLRNVIHNVRVVPALYL